MKIRKATMADLPVLLALNQSVQDRHARALPAKFRKEVPAATMERALADMVQSASWHWLVAEAKGKPAGFLSAEFRVREENWCMVRHQVCYVGGLVVAPGFRRRGLARALLGELKREAKARGVTSLELDVWAFNEEAREAFRRLGFERVMERMALAVKGPAR